MLASCVMEVSVALEVAPVRAGQPSTELHLDL